MSKVLNGILMSRPWVAHIDDERELGNGIIITLSGDLCFRADPGCGVRGCDTVKEVMQHTFQSMIETREGVPLEEAIRKRVVALRRSGMLAADAKIQAVNELYGKE